MKYTKQQRLDIGRRIYEGEITKYHAAELYDISDETAKTYMRLYRNKVTDHAANIKPVDHREEQHNKSYTKEERLNIGRRIYEGEITRYQAVKIYEIGDDTARRYMRLYRDVNNLPPKQRWGNSAASAAGESRTDVSMKVLLLAGGLGTRISEESDHRPKPMVEIGGMPILWHIMKEYLYYGFSDFVVCAGYRQYMIKKWFADYAFYTSDMTIDFNIDNNSSIISGNNNNDSYKIKFHNNRTEPWRVTVLDTGLNTNTGGRIKRAREHIGNETFMMTYGDGVCDVDIRKLLEFHRSHGKLATLTSVIQKQQKGILDISTDNSVRSFREKSHDDCSLINAGYMVLEPEIFDYLDDNTVFETEALSKLAQEGQLMSYTHNGFWQCMDNLLEKRQLETMLEAGNAPWVKWE